jgi:hypothetical protein
MNFFEWLVTENQEQEERQAAYEKSMAAYEAIAAKYKFKLADVWVQNEKKYFEKSPIEEVRESIKNLEKQIKQQDEYYARQAREEEQKRKSAIKSIKGTKQTYQLADTSYQRIVCSEGSPEYEKNGMQAYSMQSVDGKLKNYYGVHVGGGWLGILKRDGYCDSGDAYEYTIHCEEMIEDGINVWIMEDPNVANRDNSTPASWIIFSKKKIIPAKYIELGRITKEKDIKEAPPPYGMD